MGFKQFWGQLRQQLPLLLSVSPELRTLSTRSTNWLAIKRAQEFDPRTNLTRVAQLKPNKYLQIMIWDSLSDYPDKSLYHKFSLAS